MPPRSEPDLRVTLHAELGAAVRARDRLGRWLDALDWPEEQHDDLVLAVSEAVSNSVEHGYGVDHGAVGRGGTVEVVGVVHTLPGGRRYAVLTVTDHGVWLAPSDVRGNRRHGLPMMAACAESVTVDGTGTGTTVVLRSHPVPPAC